MLRAVTLALSSHRDDEQIKGSQLFHVGHMHRDHLQQDKRLSQAGVPEIFKLAKPEASLLGFGSKE